MRGSHRPVAARGRFFRTIQGNHARIFSAASFRLNGSTVGVVAQISDWCLRLPRHRFVKKRSFVSRSAKCLQHSILPLVGTCRDFLPGPEPGIRRGIIQAWRPTAVCLARHRTEGHLITRKALWRRLRRDWHPSTSLRRSNYAWHDAQCGDGRQRRDRPSCIAGAWAIRTRCAGGQPITKTRSPNPSSPPAWLHRRGDHAALCIPPPQWSGHLNAEDQKVTQPLRKQQQHFRFETHSSPPRTSHERSHAQDRRLRQGAGGIYSPAGTALTAVCSRRAERSSGSVGGLRAGCAANGPWHHASAGAAIIRHLRARTAQREGAPWRRSRPGGCLVLVRQPERSDWHGASLIGG